jgi:hypothetical protein
VGFDLNPYFYKKKGMEASIKRIWGLGLLLGIVLMAGMLVQSYYDYLEAQEQCFNCFAEQYDFVKNEMLPIAIYCLGGLLAAWIIHRYLTPALLRQQFGFIAVLLTVLAGCFILISAIGYGYFNIDLWGDDGEGDLSASTYFSALHLVKDSMKLLMVIIGFESFSVFYAFVLDKARDSRSVVLKALAEFMLFTFTLYLLWYITRLAEQVISDDYGNYNWIYRLQYWIVPVIVLHLHWFYRCLPILSSGFRLDQFTRYIELLLVPALIFFYLATFPSNDFWHRLFLPFMGIHALGILSAFLRTKLLREKRSFLTEVSQTSAELGALRAQINPHFLFNALNTLYAIAMKEHSEKTADGIQKLGDMMRFMLQENHQNRIPLAKEIEYLHNLINIQQLRLDENQQIELKINLQNPEREVFIAPMLLNPFVENAFKHGISFRNPSWIYITLTHDPERIYFKVHNSYHPKSELDPEKDSHGIGLENVRKRLELLYPDQHELSIQVSEHDYFVSLVLTVI